MGDGIPSSRPGTAADNCMCSELHLPS
ncbi:unnamed protein product [Aspergillus niger]|uniref:Contig An07c0220, genomic contig n=1 Tax=Aspergillus niger (strain ATCC MYA-4892 / CBS 513.88 / FGSC A1513) TaxID=425011 RepID=A5AAV5_ASPNC|nr:unnamed protein product [Aspergillus niger]